MAEGLYRELMGVDGRRMEMVDEEDSWVVVAVLVVFPVRRRLPWFFAFSLTHVTRL